MAQFVAHDTSFTSEVEDCKFKCPENPADPFPTEYDEKNCYPMQIFSNDSFWGDGPPRPGFSKAAKRKTCDSYTRSIHGPPYTCKVSIREQANKVYMNALEY